MNKPTFKDVYYLCIQKLTNFPYIEQDFDALTNYELLCKVVEYLNKVISNENNQNESILALYEAFNNLKTYVDNFFDTLDVQEEINNKLDEMASDGTLQEIISDYLNAKAIFGFDNVESMKESTNLINGSYARTLGFYQKNDGGASLYKIRNITNDDIVDEMTIIEIGDSENQLIAELIIKNNSINLKQLGSKNNGVDIDTQYIKKALELSENKHLNIIIPTGTSLVNETLAIAGNTSIIGENGAKIKATSTYTVINTFKCIFKNKNSVMHTNIDENIHFKNITLESTHGDNGHDGLIQFRGVKNSTIKDCNFIVNGANSWGIILFSANKNIEINNVNIDNISADNSLGGCLWVRGGLAYTDDGSKSYGIHITNSNFTSTAKDECVSLADGVDGTWVEVQIDNCNIIGKAETNLPNFLLVENAKSVDSYLKINCSNINISGKCGNYAVAIGYSGIPVDNTDFTNTNLNINVTGGGGIRSYSTYYIINNSIIKCSTSNSCYGATVTNSFLNRVVQGCRVYNCNISTSTGNGCDACYIVKGCYINAYNNGIKTMGTHDCEWSNNHIIAKIGHGIYAQADSTNGITNSIISGNYITRAESSSNSGLAGINIPYAKRTALVNNRIFAATGNASGEYKAFQYSVIKSNSTDVTETENNVTYISS